MMLVDAIRCHSNRKHILCLQRCQMYMKVGGQLSQRLLGAKTETKLQIWEMWY